MQARSRLYSIWLNMRQRCSNPNASGYANYGGRGIKVSPVWDSFDAFEQWALSNGYADQLTIEREDGSKDYDPSNCSWKSWSKQQSNKRKRQNAKHKFIGIRKLPSGNYQAIIQGENLPLKSLGSFPTEAEAVEARNSFIKQNNLPHTLN